MYLSENEENVMVRKVVIYEYDVNMNSLKVNGAKILAPLKLM